MEEKDKRYLVFGYDCYYPTGGMTDLIGSFDEKHEAIEFSTESRYDNVEIYDRVKGEEVSWK